MMKGFQVLVFCLGFPGILVLIYLYHSDAIFKSCGYKLLLKIGLTIVKVALRITATEKS